MQTSCCIFIAFSLKFQWKYNVEVLQFHCFFVELLLRFHCILTKLQWNYQTTMKRQWKDNKSTMKIQQTCVVVSLKFQRKSNKTTTPYFQDITMLIQFRWTFNQNVLSVCRFKSSPFAFVLQFAAQAVQSCNTIFVHIIHFWPAQMAPKKVLLHWHLIYVCLHLHLNHFF